MQVYAVNANSLKVYSRELQKVTLLITLNHTQETIQTT